MTGYTVHTGTSKKFASGWDQIFGDPPKKAGEKTAKKKGAKEKTAIKKKSAASAKSAAKKKTSRKKKAARKSKK